MTDMPKRDITGECEGECRDRVHEGEMERQEDINASSHESPEYFHMFRGQDPAKINRVSSADMYNSCSEYR
jgi:hypothetical protein